LPFEGLTKNFPRKEGGGGEKVGGGANKKGTACKNFFFRLEFIQQKHYFYSHVCMYVCMHACMYVYMYVCMRCINLQRHE
jgi:hypothetical protein